MVRFNITNSGGQLAYAGTYADIATDFTQPTELTFGINSGDQDNLYVSDRGTDTVVKITGRQRAVAQQQHVRRRGSGGLNYPSGLTWGSDGKLYVMDTGATSPFAGQVLVYNTNGSFDEVFTQPSD